MSILLPPDGARTVSQALAASEGRVVAETQLWKELTALCRKAKIPLNQEAPDYVIMTTGAPTLDVIRIAEDPDAQEEQQAGMDGDPSTLFAEGSEAESKLKEALTSKVMEVLTAATGEPSAEPEKKPAKRSRVAKGKKK